MRDLNKFQIVIEDHNQVFYPGQTVTGHVIVDVKHDLKLGEVSAVFHGYAEVHWTEYQTTQQGTTTSSYYNHETYFEKKFVLLQKAENEDTKILKPGPYIYPFSFTLPMRIPSSYEAHIGRVRYCIKAQIDRPSTFNENTTVIFTVLNLFDLNTRPELLNGASATDQKVFCCLCCASDPIIAHVSVDRQGFVPGETITVNADIDNRSNRTMKCSKLSLVMQVNYHAVSKSRTVMNVLYKKEQGKIEGGGTDVWRNEKIPIPPVPPSYLLGCKIIDIRYLVMVTVDPSRIGTNLDVPVEVVIGSIPLSSIAQQYGLNIPSVARSAMDRVFIKEDSNGEHTTGNSNYVPVYTYYHRKKQDPAEYFTVQNE